MNEEKLEDLAKRAGSDLRSSEMDVPADVQARLVAARREAVALADRPARLGRSWLWLPAGGVAAAVVVGLVMFPQVDNQSLPYVDNLVAVVEADAVLSEMDLLDELEFVAWMVEEDAIQPG